MNASRRAWPGLILFVLLAGCASTGTNADKGRGPTQQAPMSGVDSNYRHAGVFTGESGKYTVYSSEKAKAMAEEKARREAEVLPSAIEPGSEEAREYEQWKADQEYAEFQAWKKAQAEQQHKAGPAAESD